MHQLSESMWEHSFCKFMKMFQATCEKKRFCVAVMCFSCIRDNGDWYVCIKIINFVVFSLLRKATAIRAAEGNIKNKGYALCSSGLYYIIQKRIAFPRIENPLFATCSEEDTHHENNSFSSNPLIVDLLKDIKLEPFLTLAKEIQNLLNTKFKHGDPSKTKLCCPKSAILFSIITFSPRSQQSIENDEHVHIRDS